MSDSLVPLNSLNDLRQDEPWRIFEIIYFVEGLRKVGKIKSQVFNFVIGNPDETAMLVEAWGELAVICSAIVHEQKSFYIANGEILPDTFTHKYRVATATYKIRLKYGAEISKEKELNEKLSSVSLLSRMIQTREISKNDNLENERYYVFATVKSLENENNLYKTCTDLKCLRRTVFCWGSSPKCQACNQLSDDFAWNFRIIMLLSSESGEIRATIFAAEAEKLLGFSAKDAVQLRKNDPSALSQLFKKVEDNHFIFRLRPHLHNEKLEFTVSEFFKKEN